MNGKDLLELRREKGLTQEKLARMLNISVTTISRLESGRTKRASQLLEDKVKSLAVA